MQVMANQYLSSSQDSLASMEFIFICRHEDLATTAISPELSLQDSFVKDLQVCCCMYCICLILDARS